jgi:hypothetical protein
MTATAASSKHQPRPASEDVLLLARRHYGCRRPPKRYHALARGTRPPWTGAWTGCRGIPGTPSAVFAFAVSSVQLTCPLDRTVLMVRRRSTVRVRDGTSGHGQSSNVPDEQRGPSPGDAPQPRFSEGSHCTARAGRRCTQGKPSAGPGGEGQPRGLARWARGEPDVRPHGCRGTVSCTTAVDWGGA